MDCASRISRPSPRRTRSTPCAALAERLGWDSVWTTDHVLVDSSERADEYRTNYDAIQTLAWVGARYPTIKLGTSVIVVPQRNAVVLAKELASLDALSGGRVIAGVGVGWSEHEFANLAMSAPILGPRRLSRRDHPALAPPVGRLGRAVPGPIPRARGLRVRSVAATGRRPADLDRRSCRQAALERTGRLADGYHASASSPEAVGRRIQVIRAAAEAAGRPMPTLSARVRVEFDEPVRSAEARSYAMRGAADDIADEIAKWTELGVEHLALHFDVATADQMLADAERFDREVVSSSHL